MLFLRMVIANDSNKLINNSDINVVFTKDEDLSGSENVSTPFHDAQFGGVFAGNVRLGVTADTEIDTSSGNLILDSNGGTVQITDNLDLDGNGDVSGTLAVGSTLTYFYPSGSVLR